MNNIEVLYQLEQQRLEQVRQDIQLRSLIKPHHLSLRLRTAKTLRGWAYQLSPELEREFVLVHK